MATDSPTQPQSLRPTPITRHESSDAWPGWIFGIVAFLAISVFAIHLILAGVVHGLYARPTPPDTWQPLPRPAQAASPPKVFPRLQISPAEDLAGLRAREETELNTYGWINRTMSVVRLPISRAMDLLLERGLPVRSGTNQVQTGPSSWELEQQRPLHREPEIGGRR